MNWIALSVFELKRPILFWRFHFKYSTLKQFEKRWLFSENLKTKLDRTLRGQLKTFLRFFSKWFYLCEGSSILEALTLLAPSRASFCQKYFDIEIFNRDFVINLFETFSDNQSSLRQNSQVRFEMESCSKSSTVPIKNIGQRGHRLKQSGFFRFCPMPLLINFPIRIDCINAPYSLLKTILSRS